MRKFLFKRLLKLAMFAGMMYVAFRASKPVFTGRSRIDDLITRSKSELDDIFLAGETPTLAEMNGTFNGNVLGGILILDIQWVKNFINLGWFPWKGKIFEPISPVEGKGINRFAVGPFTFVRYHCETFISNPLVGTKDVYRLNYDLPGNPWYIRQIRDDIMKIDDGLYLGTANFHIWGEHEFVIYFVLESTTS